MPTFNLGRVAVKPRGVWSAGVANYKYLETVIYGGAGYMVNISTGSVPVGTLPTNTAYFDKVVDKGDKGDKGDMGSPGTGKIPTWTAQDYSNGSQVLHLGKSWTANDATVAGEIPGTSTKWVEDLSAYNTKSVFQISATGDNLPVLKDAIYDLQITGANAAKFYSLTVVQKQTGNWTLRVYQADNATGTGQTLALEYVSVTNPETTSVQVHEFTSKIAGISGAIALDWSKIPLGTAYTGMWANSYPLSNYVFQSNRNGVIDLYRLNNAVQPLKDTSFYEGSLTPINRANNNISVFSPSAKGSFVPILRNAIYDLKIVGADPTKFYSITAVQRTAILWSVQVYEATNDLGAGLRLALSFSTSTTTPTGVQVHKFISSITGISGSIAIDWNKLPLPTAYSSLWSNLYPLSEFVFQKNRNGIIDSAEAYNTTQTQFYTGSQIPITRLNNNISVFDLSASGQFLSILRDAIYDLKILGSDPSMFYSLTVISRGNPGWSLRIYRSSDIIGTGQFLALDYNVTVNPETSGVQVHEFTSNVIGLSGSIAIDWGKLPNATSYSPLWANLYPLASHVFQRNRNGIIDAAEGRASKPVFKVVLPQKLYLLTGGTYWFYQNVIVKAWHMFNKYPLRLDITAKKASDNSVLDILDNSEIVSGQIPANASPYYIDFVLSEYSANGKQTNIFSTQRIDVLTKTKPTGVTKNPLIVADSYIDLAWGDGIMNYIKAFAIADGNTISYKGTRTSYGNLAEARAGWQEDLFYTKYVPVAQRGSVNDAANIVTMKSPFVFSTNDTQLGSYFSFSEYLSTNGIVGLDTVIFFLGMNGGDGSKTNLMITNMKAANANLKFLVCMVPPAELDGYGTTNNDTRQLGRLEVNEKYLTQFEGREAEGIYVVPTHMNFHRQLSLNATTRTPVQFNENTFALDRIVNDHHPNASGAKGIAYMIYNYLMYV